MEYARSLIKQRSLLEDFEEEEEAIAEDSTIRNHDNLSPSSFGSASSLQGALSEDWSVISDQEDRRSSVGSRSSESRKRTSFTAAVMSVLPDSFTPGSPQQRRTL